MKGYKDLEGTVEAKVGDKVARIDWEVPPWLTQKDENHRPVLVPNNEGSELLERTMIENKFTPGPWAWDDAVWDYDPKEQAPWLVTTNGGSTVMKGEINCGFWDAHLIAAAPDLYNALALILDDPESLDGRPRTYEAVRKAMAKARGEK